MRTGAPGLEARPGGYTDSPEVSPPRPLLSSPTLPIRAPVYQYTQYRPFLDTSLKMARVFIDRLESSPNTIDGVPAWDFDAPAPTSADTTAASVAAAGFVHLADGLEKANNTSEAQLWVDRSFKVSWFLIIYIHNARPSQLHSTQLLSDTAHNFFAPHNSDWQSILTNGTSFYFKGEKDQGVIYGAQYNSPFRWYQPFFFAIWANRRFLFCGGRKPPPQEGPDQLPNLY